MNVFQRMWSSLVVGQSSLLKHIAFMSSQHHQIVKGNVVRTNVYHKYIKDLKLNITIDLDGFIYYPSS